MQSIPIGMNYRDTLALAPTGSGESGAFLLPVIQFMLNMPLGSGISAEDGHYALIMAPTSELA